MTFTRPNVPLTVWILVCTWCSLVGWSLSALGQLNATGYAVAMGAGGVLLALAWRRLFPGWRFRLRFKRLRWRHRHLLPAMYSVAAGLALLGGALHPPNNYDALTYRLPRMLHWLAEQRWHWIVTPNARMNFSGLGFEWLQTPLFLLTGGDRLLFLLNWLSFLLMPGLIFGVFRAVEVRGRVAWFWMWFLPLSYGYALQAGSIGNDAFAVIFALAAVRFGFDARTSGSMRSVLLSLLAGALLTGVKTSNLPLVLPIIVAVWPALVVLAKRPLIAAAAMILAATVSFLPLAVLNQIHTGQWTGDPENAFRLQLRNPLAGLVGNGIQILTSNLSPPVLPMARRLESRVMEFMPASLREWLRAEFPRFTLWFGELPSEEGSGLGLGCSLLALILAGAGLVRARSWRAGLSIRRIASAPSGVWIALSGGVATLAFMVKLGSEAAARLVLPYYPFWILLAVLAASGTTLHQCRCWRVVSLLSAASTLIVLLVLPARPLLPLESSIHWVLDRHPTNPSITYQLERAQRVCAVYRERNDVLGPLRRHLPSMTKPLGLVMSLDDSEYALWRPLGQRRVVHLVDDHELAAKVPHDMDWVAIRISAWSEFSEEPLDLWLTEWNGEVVGKETIMNKVSEGEAEWWVVRLGSPRR